MAGFLAGLSFKKTKQEPTPSSPEPEKVVIGSDEALDAQIEELTRHRNEARTMQRESAYEIMAETLYRDAQREFLFSYGDYRWNGVALRLSKGKYVYTPRDDIRLKPWVSALCALNCESALTVTATVVFGITSALSYDATEVALSPEVRVQVVDTLDDLAFVRKAQGAAFVRSEHMLCVWSDHVSELISNAKALEEKMIRFIWQRAIGQEPASSQVASIATPASMAGAASASHLSFSCDSQLSPSPSVPSSRVAAGGERLVTSRKFADSEKCPEGEDPEAMITVQERPTNMQAPLQHGLAVALNTLLTFGLLSRRLVYEALLDHTWVRFAIAAAILPCFVVTLFFSDSIINGLAQIFAPIRQMSLNSRYYSGKAPERMMGKLPHITIQMPVYKESLDTVLIPTIESVKKAIKTYELQGGTAALLIAEDGLLLVGEEERQKRLEYYEMNQIGWVARPGHGVDGFVRAGRFKKASNLNFTCAVSLAVERTMAAERPSGPEFSEWTHDDENALYESALARALAEAHPLAKGAGNVRIGEFILLIDCDTRIPEDSFLDAASEMTQCPEVAILQHCSGVMMVTEDNYFERGIAFFTRCINYAISYVVANGDVAPFMGHNAYLRWSAIQEAAAPDAQGVTRVWSENTVSEDFEISLRVVMKGYIVRWATYSNEGYMEGVSLSAEDELNRWQKYAFGVSELLFNPISQWFRRGPVTSIWWRYMWAKGVPVHAKFASASYIFSYYAIGSALPLTIALALVQGWFAPVADGAFLPPFSTFIAVFVVFSGLGVVGSVVGKFRSRRMGFWPALKEHLVWFPFLTVFFSGLSYHVLTALISHLVGYNMSWGSTLKDLEDSNFFRELPSLFRKHWKMLCVCISMIVGFAILEALPAIPLDWQLRGGFVVLWCPMLIGSMHIIYLLTLNPQMLRFSF